MQNTCQNCDCGEEKEGESKDACCETGECACDEETKKEEEGSCCGGCDCGV